MFLSLILFRRTKLVNLIFLLSILHGTFAFSEAVIEVIKRGQPQLPIAGEVFSYSFTLRNIGDEIAENLLFSDTLPAGFHYQQSETPCSVTSTNPDVVECRAAGNAFTAPQYQLAVGEIVTFELLVSIEPQIIGVVSNQATVTLDNATYSVNSFPDDITVQSVSDLKVQKFASKIRAKAGQQFDYLMVVENNGPSTAFHPVIRDTLFMQTVSNAQWVRANGCSLSVRDCGGLTQEFQCNFALATGVFDLATIGATTLHPTGYYDCDGDLPGDPGYEPTVNGRIVMTINLQAYEDGALNNIVEVFAGDNISTDPNPENNIATTVTPFDASSDLQVTKIISSDPGQPWIAGASQVIYQVTVTNLGISRAENVVLKDFLPKGVSIVDISVLNGDTGSCLSGTPGNPEDPILCKLGTLTPTGHPEEGEGDTATKTVEITINVDSDFPIDAKTCGSILNNSAWASSDSMDLDNSNNAAFISALVEGSTADLKVTKFQTSSQEKAGDALTYKILVQNLGPCTARMVTLSDTGIADGNFTIESLNSDRAMSCSPMAPLNTEIQDFYFACTLDQPLEPVPQAPGGGAWTLTMEINADDGITLTNDATLTHMGIDPDLKNNEVLISGDVGALADLAVIKQAEGETDNIPGYDTN
ncbi:MAG: DUF11 domain-containing protein [Myxococcales bacterium]|nr:DUF11 domain-containing protein [Myxococcales bacterium]